MNFFGKNTKFSRNFLMIFASVGWTAGLPVIQHRSSFMQGALTCYDKNKFLGLKAVLEKMKKSENQYFERFNYR